MPQLDPRYWASQAFWLILVFTILYISIAKFYLPKIKVNLDKREIRIKENQNVEKIFLSSLFKKNKNFLGINKFKLLSKITKKNIVVLGGVSIKNLKKLSLLNQSDFAGISYFE